MSSPAIERKLAAIMFTDIAGYTEQMSNDESVAISLLNNKESILKPLIKEHNGTYVKSIGDGSLSHFKSAVDAAMCAKRFQESIYDDKDLNVRAGVHLGDTIFEKDDIRGDGENIAARLESMAPEGGVFVSKEVYDQLANQKEFDGVSIGLQNMKGVGRLIEVYGLKGDKLTEPNPNEYQDNNITIHTDDEVPSIAIIPFENKGANEDVFYAYGISADLISDVSSAGMIRVPSLKRVEELTDLKLDEKAKKLDVRYTVEGALWKMGQMFQLSIELYDTKEKKVVWSDRWQEKWDNLPNIKTSLSDGLLKALDTKVEQKVNTSNPEAYEFYLKAKHKYNKRENTDDIKIARGLLQKAIELDDNLIGAKDLLGSTYGAMGDYDEAMLIFTSALKQSKEIDDKHGIGRNLNKIGLVYSSKGDYDKTLDYYGMSLVISEKLDNKRGMGFSLSNIGNVYSDKGDYDKALDYYTRALAIREELGDQIEIGMSFVCIGVVQYDKGDYDKALDYYTRALVISEDFGDKSVIGNCLNNIANVYYAKGDYDKALDYYIRALSIDERLGDKRGMVFSLYSIGVVYLRKGGYKKAENYLEKCLSIQKEIGLKVLKLETTTCHYLTYKHLGKEYDEKHLHSLIKDAENIGYKLNFTLYWLLDDTSYLETAYMQVQDEASVMEEELGKTFLSYPQPKAIVEEWKKIQ